MNLTTQEPADDNSTYFTLYDSTTLSKVDADPLGGLEYISRHPATAIPYLTLATFACALGIVGNITALFAVFSYKPLRNINNAILVNLALADLTVASLGDTFSVVGKCMGSSPEFVITDKLIQ